MDIKRFETKLNDEEIINSDKSLRKFNDYKCSKCDNEFNFWDSKELPFYTIVENNQMKRVCPKCFSKYSHLWIG